ncbi:MAG: UDP-2,3-diacylglucosamine diphosphatase LpxI [Stappiaceae bacterium]
MTSPIALIAGNGQLPLEVAQSIRENGHDLLVVGIKGEAVEEISELSPHWLDWGQIGKLFKLLKSNDCRDVILIGGVRNRPDFRSIMGDLGTIRRLPRIVSALNGGDDNVLLGVIRLFEDDGFRIVGAHEYAPSLLAGRGMVIGTDPDPADVKDIEIAINVAATLGHLDVGQAVVVSGGRVLAVEAAEGTDLMLQRCIDLKSSGRFSWKGRQGVLAKCTKPGQDLRVDLPTIGPNTIEKVTQVGLAGLVISADTVFIAEKDKTLSLAEKANLFIKGI